MGSRLSVALCAAGALAGAAVPAYAAQTFVQFNLVDVGGAGAGTPYEAIMRTAANYWSSVLTTSAPVTITIEMEAYGFSESAAFADYSQTFYRVASVQNSLQGFARTTAFDDIASAAFPMLSDGVFGPATALAVTTPGYTDGVARTGIDNNTAVFDADGSFNNSAIALTRANARALGLYSGSGVVDGRVTFSTTTNLDFDPLDGIGAGKGDALAVAIHEIGHVLGFISGVDSYDFDGTGGPNADADCGGFLCKNSPVNDQYYGYALDLFRYRETGALDWTTGTESYFSVDNGATPFLGGYFETGAFNGSGLQASHWRDNLFDVGPDCTVATTPPLGVLDPRVGRCQVGAVTALDIAAFDAIGWNTSVDVLASPSYRMTSAEIAARFGAAVPEPGTWLMFLSGFGVVGGVVRRSVRRGGGLLTSQPT